MASPNDPSPMSDPRPRDAASAGVQGSKADHAAAAEAFRALRNDFTVLGRECFAFARAKLDRAGIGMRSAARDLLLGAVGLVVVTFFLIRCAAELLDGVRGAALAATGSPWFAQLLAGALGIGAFLAFLACSRRSAERARVEAFARKYGNSNLAQLSSAPTTNHTHSTAIHSTSIDPERP